MTIKYWNGRITEGVVLTDSGDAMRMALRDREDTVEFRRVSGTWVTEDCEPVQVAYFQKESVPPVFSEEQFICSPELAARLIELLATDSTDVPWLPAEHTREQALPALSN